MIAHLTSQTVSEEEHIHRLVLLSPPLAQFLPQCDFRFFLKFEEFNSCFQIHFHSEQVCRNLLGISCLAYYFSSTWQIYSTKRVLCQYGLNCK